VSPRDALPAAARRELKARRAEEPERPIDIVVEGVRAPGVGSDPGAVRAAVERVDGGAEVRTLSLLGAVACALRPADILRLALDPVVARITLDQPRDVGLEG